MTAYEIALTVQLEPEQIPPDNPRRGNWRGVLAQAVADLLNAEAQTLDAELIFRQSEWRRSCCYPRGAAAELRSLVIKNPSWLGKTGTESARTVFLPVSDSLDQYAKGLLVPSTQDGALVSPKTAELFDQLRQAGVVQRKFAWRFFVRADSRFPALAGNCRSCQRLAFGDYGVFVFIVSCWCGGGSVV